MEEFCLIPGFKYIFCSKTTHESREVKFLGTGVRQEKIYLQFEANGVVEEHAPEGFFLYKVLKPVAGLEEGESAILVEQYPVGRAYRSGNGDIFTVVEHGHLSIRIEGVNALYTLNPSGITKQSKPSLNGWIGINEMRRWLKEGSVEQVSLFLVGDN